MKFIEKVLRAIISFLFRVESLGEGDLPKDGACVVCINHISIFDPLVLSCAVTRSIRFIAKEEVFKVPVVGWYLKSINVIPIKRGAADIGAIKESLRALKSGEVLGIFPTGTRERKNPNAEVKSGAAMIALKADVPVIPVHINASYKPFSRVGITIGREIDLSDYRGRKLSQDELSEVSKLIYSHIKALGDVK